MIGVDLGSLSLVQATTAPLGRDSLNTKFPKRSNPGSKALPTTERVPHSSASAKDNTKGSTKSSIKGSTKSSIKDSTKSSIKNSSTTSSTKSNAKARVPSNIWLGVLLSFFRLAAKTELNQVHTAPPLLPLASFLSPVQVVWLTDFALCSPCGIGQRWVCSSRP